MTDPRVIRTKEALSEALFELMGSRRWDKIRVQDILDRSGVSRSAFYSHFSDKHDLLTSRIPQLFVEVHVTDDGKPNLEPLFAHVDEGASVMRPLLSQPVGVEISVAFHSALAEMWSRYLAGADGEPAEVDPMLTDLLAAALLAVCKTYISQRTREQPAVVAARFVAHVHPMLEAYSLRAA